jgi:hypothetical protein
MTTTDKPMPKLQLEMTLDQAAAVRDALDAYMRLCIGQLEEVAQLVRLGVIPKACPASGERILAPPEVCRQVEVLMNDVKALLG